MRTYYMMQTPRGISLAAMWTSGSAPLIQFDELKWVKAADGGLSERATYAEAERRWAHLLGA